MPAALPEEGAFAANNSSLFLYGKKEIYFAPGGPAARVFHSSDLGRTWAVIETPILSGKSFDQGKTWRLTAAPLTGFRWAVATG